MSRNAEICRDSPPDMDQRSHRLLMGFVPSPVTFTLWGQKVADDLVNADDITERTLGPPHGVSCESCLGRAGRDQGDVFFAARGIPPQGHRSFEGRFHGENSFDEFGKVDLNEPDHRRTIGGYEGAFFGPLADEIGRRIGGEIEGDGGVFRNVGKPLAFKSLFHEAGTGIGSHLHVEGRIRHKNGILPGFYEVPFVLVYRDGLALAAADAFSAVDAQVRDDAHQTVDHSDGLGGTGLDAVCTPPAPGFPDFYSPCHGCHAPFPFLRFLRRCLPGRKANDCLEGRAPADLRIDGHGIGIAVDVGQTHSGAEPHFPDFIRRS